MKRWIKLLVTIALAVSIPLQGLAAVSMPACIMSTDSMKTSIVMSTSDADFAVDKLVITSASCDMKVKNCCDLSGNNTCSDQKCSTCHFGAFQLPNSGLLVTPDSLASVYQDLISEPYQTFPPALFHPPKLLSI
ncbi:MAG: hypothetical protein ABL885_15570 [Methylophilaceae bacterium]|jgi:hypothetical protein